MAARPAAFLQQLPPDVADKIASKTAFRSGSCHR